MRLDVIAQQRAARGVGERHFRAALGEASDAALALAEQIIVNTPLGTWMGKATLWSNLEISSLEAAIDLEARTQILTLATDDAREQLEAYREGRAARYTNH